MDLQNGIKTSFYLACNYRTFFFSLPLTEEDIHVGHVKMYATPYPISWIIFKLDLAPTLINVVPIGTKCAPVVADLFYTATKDISWILLTMTIKLLFECK